MRRLALSRETLSELATADLAAVAGAAKTLDQCIATISAADLCDSYFRPCISNTCTR